MAVGAGPHEGRNENLEEPVAVSLEPRVERALRRQVAERRARTGSKFTLSALLRELIEAGLRSPETGWPRRREQMLGKQKFVRLEHATVERLKGLAVEEQRQLGWIIRGVIGRAIQNDRPPPSAPSTNGNGHRRRSRAA